MPTKPIKLKKNKKSKYEIEAEEKIKKFEHFYSFAHKALEASHTKKRPSYRGMFDLQMNLYMSHNIETPFSQGFNELIQTLDSYKPPKLVKASFVVFEKIFELDVPTFSGLEMRDYFKKSTYFWVLSMLGVIKPKRDQCGEGQDLNNLYSLTLRRAILRHAADGTLTVTPSQYFTIGSRYGVAPGKSRFVALSESELGIEAIMDALYGSYAEFKNVCTNNLIASVSKVAAQPLRPDIDSIEKKTKEATLLSNACCIYCHCTIVDKNCEHLLAWWSASLAIDANIPNAFNTNHFYCCGPCNARVTNTLLPTPWMDRQGRVLEKNKNFFRTGANPPLYAKLRFASEGIHYTSQPIINRVQRTLSTNVEGIQGGVPSILPADPGDLGKPSRTENTHKLFKRIQAIEEATVNTKEIKRRLAIVLREETDILLARLRTILDVMGHHTLYQLYTSNIQKVSFNTRYTLKVLQPALRDPERVTAAISKLNFCIKRDIRRARRRELNSRGVRGGSINLIDKRGEMLIRNILYDLYDFIVEPKCCGNDTDPINFILDKVLNTLESNNSNTLESNNSNKEYPNLENFKKYINSILDPLFLESGKDNESSDKKSPENKSPEEEEEEEESPENKSPEEKEEKSPYSNDAYEETDADLKSYKYDVSEDEAAYIDVKTSLWPMLEVLLLLSIKAIDWICIKVHKSESVFISDDPNKTKQFKNITLPDNFTTNDSVLRSDDKDSNVYDSRIFIKCYDPELTLYDNLHNYMLNRMNRKIDIRLLSDLDIDAIKEKPSSFMEEIFLEKYKEVSSSIDNIESTLEKVFTKQIEEDKQQKAEMAQAAARELKIRKQIEEATRKSDQKRIAREQQIQSNYKGKMHSGLDPKSSMVRQNGFLKNGITAGGGKKTNKNKRIVKTQKLKLKRKKSHSNKKTKYKK